MNHYEEALNQWVVMGECDDYPDYPQRKNTQKSFVKDSSFYDIDIEVERELEETEKSRLLLLSGDWGKCGPVWIPKKLIRKYEGGWIRVYQPILIKIIQTQMKEIKNREKKEEMESMKKEYNRLLEAYK